MNATLFRIVVENAVRKALAKNVKKDDIDWVTIHGIHIPLKEGETVEDKVKELKEKNENSSKQPKNLKTHEEFKNDLISELKKVEDDYDSVGLRIIDSDYGSKEGDELESSSVWVDGEPTDEKLSGTSSIGLASGGFWAEYISDKKIDSALENLALYGKGDYGYFGDTVALIGGSSSEGGEDRGESIIRNAKIIKLYKIIKNEGGEKTLEKI